MKSEIIKYSFLLAYVLLAGCANTLPPSGGPPSTLAPRVLQSEPANRTVNFSVDEISLQFNKYMDKSSVVDNVFISPSADLAYNWSGKELTIKFLSELSENTTYSLTIGTDCNDYFDKNKPEEAYNLIFSTGSTIDSGSAEGILYDEKPQGIYVFAYYLDGIDRDTLNPSKTKAPYITQAGTNGKFCFNALKDGWYRVIAVRDQFKDGVYDEGIDGYGTCLSDVFVKYDSIPKIKLKIRDTLDKSSPILFEADAKSGNVISGIFSKNLDTFSIRSSSFLLEDSASRKAVDIASCYLKPGTKTNVEIISSELLDTSRTYRLTALAKDGLAILDSSGNEVPDTANTAYFKPDSGKKEIQPYLLGVPLKDSTKQVHLDKEFAFQFNTGIKSDLKNNLRLYNLADSTAKEFEIIKKADNYFILKPVARLLSDSWFAIELSTKGLESYTGGQAKDTTYNFHFKTMDIRDFGSAAGILIDSANCGGDYYVVFISKLKKIEFTTKVDSAGNWNFDELPEGDYSVEIFCDTNRNSLYDFGNVFPYEPSENFTKIDKEVSIKPRWKVEDLKIVLR